MNLAKQFIVYDLFNLLKHLLIDICQYYFLNQSYRITTIR